ncbi:MAG TPA: group III truncated hemoglobin [Patescibacteria group bacterium]|nr:group III truncated hemoglobin [Patescibacteria group bacterium]
MTEPASATEQNIALLVREFYERGRQDPLLGPVFAGAIGDWEEHFLIVGDFWSHILLGTTRYQGRPFPAHVRLPVEPAHFDRWLELFAQTAHDVLPAAAAEQAITRAATMAASFKTGLFPWKHPDGTMSRHRPEANTTAE